MEKTPAPHVKESSLFGSLTVKIVTIGILLFVMMIPVMLVDQLVRDRRDRRDEAVASIRKSWAGRQFVSGLVLQVPYTETETANLSRQPLSTSYFQLSDSLDMTAELKPEIRRRGIFSTTIYTATVRIKGTLTIPALTNHIENVEYRPILQQAVLHIPLADSRGLSDVKVQIDGKQMNAQVGRMDSETPSLIIAYPITAESKTISYDIQLSLAGSEGLDFLPLARITKASAGGVWPSPSYEGAFLPFSKDETPGQFKGNWNVLYLNRLLPQSWFGSVPSQPLSDDSPRLKSRRYEMASEISSLQYDAFGVRLEEARDTYDTAERSTKYAILIILLTFVTFFFIEILHRRRIHPIQYLMVASGLGLFYLLLLSLAEHIDFQWAYLIAGVSIIGTLAGYIQAMFREGRFTLFISAGLTFLYAFFYVLLQSEDHALLLGSLGLLGALALAMYTTRNVDWYNLNR